MNASSWKKAADIVAKTTPVIPQASATATAESHNLQSLPLSALSIDDSRPLQVAYEPQQPIAKVHHGQQLQKTPRYLQRHIIRYYQV